MAYTVYYDTPGTILTYAQMMTALSDLDTANPAWTMVDFGDSENSLEIRGMIVHPTGYSRTMLITSALHGSEKWPARATLDLLNYLAANPTVHTDTRFIVIPLANPDGYNAGTRKNYNGVDLNRNFTVGWGETEEDARHSLPSSDPASAYYMGTSAMSEAESQILGGVITTYLSAGDVLIDGHTTLDKALQRTGFNYTNVIRNVNDYLISQEHTPFLCDRCVPLGMMRDYPSTLSLFRFIFELDGSGDIHEEVNRFIGIVKAIANDNLDTDTGNDVSADDSCVAHYPFEGFSEASDWGTDAKGGNDISVVYSALSAIAVQGATSVKCNGGSAARMSRDDADLDAGFPGKSETSNQDLALSGFFQLESAPASGVYNVLFSKWASTANQRSWALVYYNDSGTRKLQLIIGSGTSSSRVTINSGDLSLDVWYYIGLSFTNATRDVYAKLRLKSDGSTVAELSDTETITNDLFCGTARFAVNCWHTALTTVAGHADAYYDDLYIFNEPKTEADFDALFNGTYGASGGTTYDASLSLAMVGALTPSQIATLPASAMLASEASQSEASLAQMFSSLTLVADGAITESAGMTYLASLALESQADTTQGNTTTKEASVSLGTQAGFSPSVIASLLASLQLTGNAGLSPAGNLVLAVSNLMAVQTAIDAEGYIGLHVYDESLALAVESALENVASYNAGPSLTLGINADIDALSTLAAQALLTMGVDAAHVPSVTASFAASLAMGIEAALEAASYTGAIPKMIRASFSLKKPSASFSMKKPSASFELQ